MKAILKPPFTPEENTLITIGGSKSESNRLLILQARYPNITIENLSDSDDSKVLIDGLKVSGGTVDVGHAGTAMRFLTAYFASLEEAEVVLTGSPRMQERPIGILVDTLRQLGAEIEYLKTAGYPPLKIKGKSLNKNKVKIDASVSSQFISALMLIAPKLPHGIQIELDGEVASQPYIEMTLGLLQKAGIEAHFKNNEIVVYPTPEIPNATFYVESDWSSLSYFYSLIALSEGAKLRCNYFREDSLQGDRDLAFLYEGLGVSTFFEADNTVILRKNNLPLPDEAFFDLSGSPDLAQTIAVTCFGLGMGCSLEGLQTLKIKETDRLLALKTELEKLGAEVTITEDSLHLEKATEMKAGVAINTYQDHRMAMAFAPLGAKIHIEINDAEVVSKSYPDFWTDIKRVGLPCELSGF